MSQFTCTVCGADLVNYQASAIYCSSRCKDWAHRRPGRLPPPPRSSVRGCEHCGQNMEGRHGNARFCGNRCWYRFHHPLTVVMPGSCDVCGEPAMSAGSSFCSNRCEQWRRRHPSAKWPTDRRCGNCGDPIDHLHPMPSGVVPLVWLLRVVMFVVPVSSGCRVNPSERSTSSSVTVGAAICVTEGSTLG